MLQESASTKANPYVMSHESMMAHGLVSLLTGLNDIMLSFSRITSNSVSNLIKFQHTPLYYRVECMISKKLGPRLHRLKGQSCKQLA